MGGRTALGQQRGEAVATDRGELDEEALAGGLELQAHLHLGDLALAAARLRGTKTLSRGTGPRLRLEEMLALVAGGADRGLERRRSLSLARPGTSELRADALAGSDEVRVSRREACDLASQVLEARLREADRRSPRADAARGLGRGSRVPP